MTVVIMKMVTVRVRTVQMSRMKMILLHHQCKLKVIKVQVEK